MEEVTLAQILEARENRVREQQHLLERYGQPIICFTMNIPGPVKNTALIRRAFFEGCDALDHRLPKERVLHRETRCNVTGCEAMYVVSMDAGSLKEICTDLEEGTALGRLFDMDVLDRNGCKLERVGARGCLVCGAPGRGCASQRTHSVPELQKAVRDIITGYFAQKDARQIGAWATASLLDEVCTTPKPGLVDCRNNGSHRDMDLFTFLASAAALSPYFERCARIGQDTAACAPEETFQLLKAAGLRAEQDMYEATKGINTHKGAIFTMGLLCGAAGRLWKPEGGWEPEALFCQVSAMASQAQWDSPETVGQRLYARYGIRGIRGEAARGLPAVAKIGLPVFRACLEKGLDRNHAGAVTLLHLIARVEDTNMISRGGREGAKEGAARAAALLERETYPAREQMEALDDWFIERNLSPGGCADLLSAVYFVDRLLRQDLRNLTNICRVRTET